MKKFCTKDDYKGSGLYFLEIDEEAKKAANKAMESVNREVQQQYKSSSGGL